MTARDLLVLGNSVSLPPRKEAPSVVAYPELLHEELAGRGWSVVNRSTDGGTIAEIAEAARAALGAIKPAAVVLQAGIVDCAPRPLRARERWLLARVRPDLLRNRLVGLVHDYRAAIIARRSLIQWTPLDAFRKVFGQLYTACRATAPVVVVLPIFPATRDVLARNPLLAREIEKYNHAMRGTSEAAFVEVEEIFDGESIDDLAAAPESVHLNQRGHAAVAGAVQRRLTGAAGAA